MKQKHVLRLSILLNALGLIAALLLVYWLGGPQYLLYRIRSGGRPVLYDHQISQFEMLPIDNHTIVFLGNSLTAQGHWQEWFPDHKVVNRGINGDMTGGVFRRLDAILEGAPQQIFLLIGVNDLLFKSEDETIEQYKKIVQKIKTDSPTTQLILQTLLPVNNQVRYTGVDNNAIVKLNQLINNLAKEQGLKVIDLHKEFTDSEGQLEAAFTLDGVHLSGAAYAKWASIIKPYLPAHGI